MAGAPVTSNQGMPNNPTGIPGTALDYGTGYSGLSSPMSVPQGLFNGLGPAQLDTSSIPLQSYTPEYNIQYTGNFASPDQYSVNGKTMEAPGGSALKTYQNANVAGYDANQTANAQNIGYLQQAAIADNQLLGELNSRGLLNSFEQGGAGTTDFQQLQNNLNNAVNSQGASLQNELNGLTQNDAMYQMALANYNNEVGNFNYAQQQQIPGLTDIVGLGASGLPLIKGL